MRAESCEERHTRRVDADLKRPASHAPIGQMLAESFEERHTRRVDADLKRAGADQRLIC